MLSPGPTSEIFLAAGATDLRKSFDTLSALVRGRLEKDPLSGQFFVFCNSRHNRIKILFWDRTGYWVCANRPVSHCPLEGLCPTAPIRITLCSAKAMLCWR